MDFCDVSTDQRAPFSPQGRSHPPSTLNSTSSTSSSFGAGQFPARQQSPLIYPRHAAPLDGRILCYANIMSCPTSPDDTVPWPLYGHRTRCTSGRKRRGNRMPLRPPPCGYFAPYATYSPPGGSLPSTSEAPRRPCWRCAVPPPGTKPPHLISPGSRSSSSIIIWITEAPGQHTK